MKVSLLFVALVAPSASFNSPYSPSLRLLSSIKAVSMPKDKTKAVKDISTVFNNNQKWIDSKTAEDPDFFEKLGSGHYPQYLWIGCSDARVPANEIMGEDAGSVFVVRNVANMVTGTDFNAMSAIQYAVGVLEVPHIIVCGHYDCGGVRASRENLDHAPPL